MEVGTDFVACDSPNANRLKIHILAAAAVAEREARRVSERTRSPWERLSPEALCWAARGPTTGQDERLPGWPGLVKAREQSRITKREKALSGGGSSCPTCGNVGLVERASRQSRGN